MEISVLEAQGLPEGCLISVCSGSTWRQAPVEAGTSKLSLPQPPSAAPCIKVDFLDSLGSAIVDLHPQQDCYTVEVGQRLAGKSTSLRATLQVRDTETKEARSKNAYLAEHKLQGWVEELMQQLVRERPDNPWSYIENRAAFTRRYGLRDSKISGEAQAAPVEATEQPGMVLQPLVEELQSLQKERHESKKELEQLLLLKRLQKEQAQLELEHKELMEQRAKLQSEHVEKSHEKSVKGKSKLHTSFLEEPSVPAALEEPCEAQSSEGGPKLHASLCEETSAPAALEELSEPAALAEPHEEAPKSRPWRIGPGTALASPPASVYGDEEQLPTRAQAASQSPPREGKSTVETVRDRSEPASPCRPQSVATRQQNTRQALEQLAKTYGARISSGLPPNSHSKPGSARQTLHIASERGPVLTRSGPLPPQPPDSPVNCSPKPSPPKGLPAVPSAAAAAATEAARQRTGLLDMPTPQHGALLKPLSALSSPLRRSASVGSVKRTELPKLKALQGVPQWPAADSAEAMEEFRVRRELGKVLSFTKREASPAPSRLSSYRG